MGALNKQTSFYIFLSMRAPWLKLLCLAHWPEWINNPTPKRNNCRCNASVSDVPFYLRCNRVAAAAWENVNTLVAYLPSPKLACRHSFRFTLARFVSFNYLPTHRKTWNRVWTYAFLFSWSLVTHSETFVNGGSSYHCHSHLSLRSKSTILPTSRPRQETIEMLLLGA